MVFVGLGYLEFSPRYLKYNVEVKLMPKVSYSQSVEVASSVVNPTVESVEDNTVETAYDAT